VHRWRQVAVLSSTALRDKTAASGATFRHFPPSANLLALHRRGVSEYFDFPRGPESMWILKRAYVDTIPGRYAAMLQVLSDYLPTSSWLTVFSSVHCRCSALETQRLPIVMLGTMGLHRSRDDAARRSLGCLRRTAGGR
jgi:hypothetical protein